MIELFVQNSTMSSRAIGIFEGVIRWSLERLCKRIDGRITWATKTQVLQGRVVEKKVLVILIGKMNEKSTSQAIKNLEHNDKTIMVVLEKLEKKVDEIHDYMFKGEMAKNYVSRELFNLKVETLEKDFQEKLLDKQKEIVDIKANQTKVVFIIITLFIGALASLIFVK